MIMRFGYWNKITFNHLIKCWPVLTAKCQEHVVPNNGQLFWTIFETLQVFYHDCDYPLWKVVRFTYYCRNIVEYGSVGLHLTKFNQGYWWADHRDGHFQKKRLYHTYLSRECLFLAEFKHYALEPSVCFIQSFLQWLIVVII